MVPSNSYTVGHKKYTIFILVITLRKVEQKHRRDNLRSEPMYLFKNLHSTP